MIRSSKFVAALVLAGLASFVAPTAKASFIPVFTGLSVSGGVTTYGYTLNFTTNNSTETLVAGDFVTLYDTGPATVVAPGLTATQSLTGLTPPLTGPPDDATILNITFTYTGPTLTTDFTFAGIVVSSSFGSRTGVYAGTTTIASGKNQNIGNVTTPSPVPEPASIALLGLGVVGLVGVARRRKASV